MLFVVIYLRALIIVTHVSPIRTKGKCTSVGWYIALIIFKQELHKFYFNKEQSKQILKIRSRGYHSKLTKFNILDTFTRNILGTFQ